MREKSRARIAFDIAVRVVIFTFLFTLLSFAIGLFCGIVSAVIFGAIRHVHPDMTMAYKYVAAPFGAMGMIVTFITMLVLEIRRLRRPRLQFRAPEMRRTS